MLSTEESFPMKADSGDGLVCVCIRLVTGRLTVHCSEL